MTCHSNVKIIDHLSEVLKNIGKGSKLSELRLHRTKCSKIICKVLASCILQELIEDIDDSWYSIILDESTDNATVKLGLNGEIFQLYKAENNYRLVGVSDSLADHSARIVCVQTPYAKT